MESQTSFNIPDDIKEELEYVTSCSTLNVKFGAVIVKDGVVVSTGFAQRALDEEHPISEQPLLWLHSEEVALLGALKSQTDISGADIYVLGKRENGEVRHSDYSYCCVVCSRLLLQSGIRQVIYPSSEGWKKVSVRQMFEDAVKRVEDGRA